jgi:hypothetical protein
MSSLWNQVRRVIKESQEIERALDTVERLPVDHDIPEDNDDSKVRHRTGRSQIQDER